MEKKKKVEKTKVVVSDPSNSLKNDKYFIFCVVWAVFCIFVAIGINKLHFYYNTPVPMSSPIVESPPSPPPVVETPPSPPPVVETKTTPYPKPYREPGVFHTKAFIPKEGHDDIRGIPKDLENWPPGHMGLGIEITSMDKKSAAKRGEMFKRHAFEEFVSDLIPLDRELPDWRGEWCKKTYDRDVDSLPKTSIIICFHNEAWSTLLRSIHSIINRSPERLIEEIILVDDNSSLEYLRERLDLYIKEHFDDKKVKIIRLKKRHGLMRSRMEGIKVAKAEVLTFLDSHIEATIGWLEPLLHRIKEDPRVIMSPVIDAINDTTLYYTFIKKDLFGLINWRMEFEWRELDEEQRAQKPDIWAPHDNPVMAGGLFSINKKWFEELGYYDEGMDIWGGENFELSFKAWMCGGTIEISPCSRVGHIFRSWSPYKVDTRDIRRNNIRVAKVWMDEFQYLYFDRLGRFSQRGEERLGKYGDISGRKAMRENLHCKPFKWYLDNIASGLPYHQLIGAGEIRHLETGLCLDKNDRTEYMDETIDLLPCHDEGGNQYWWMNTNNYLLRDYMCIGVLDDGLSVVVTHCGRVQPWAYSPVSKKIQYRKTGTCLTAKMINNRFRLTMAKCSEEDSAQKWEFTKFNSHGLKYEELF